MSYLSALRCDHDKALKKSTFTFTLEVVRVKKSWKLVEINLTASF